MKRHLWVYLVFVSFVAGIFNGYDFLKQPLAYDGEAASIEYNSKSEGDGHPDSVAQPSHDHSFPCVEPFDARFSTLTAYASFTFNPRLSQGPPTANG